MDTEDKKPRTEGGENNKRPRGGHHHNRNRNRNKNGGGDRPDRKNDVQTPETSANSQSGQANGKGNQPPRDDRDRKKPKAGGQSQSNRGDKLDRGDKNNRSDKNDRGDKNDRAANAGGADRRPSHATGRPQRTIRHTSNRPDLPDMEDLLIDDSMNTTPSAAVSETPPDAAEIERILSRDLFDRKEEAIPEYLPEDKLVIVGVRFRTGGKTYFFDPGELTCTAGQYAVVETARGLEFGEICIGNRMVDVSLVVPPLRPVVRIATEADIAHNKENREREEAAFRIGIQKINERGLDMKLVSVQYTFDNSKLLFYFTSAGRVDFRELVKDLAGVFHIRIELRQIGIRDEARMIGGLGACGRPLCCTTFLSDFGQVSMKMAKEQNLSLNSTKISGCCGRLMCCLRYEHETYVEEIKKTPAPGTFVNTPDGPGVVTEIFPLRAEVKVSLKGQTDAPPKKYSRDQVEVRARAAAPEVTAPDEGDDEPDSDE